ncbi:MAG: cellulase family glycosylhydrolase [Kiritimatiellia bacterium]
MNMKVMMALICVCSICGVAHGAEHPGLTVQDGRLYRNGQPYRGIGANYFDLFLRILINAKDTSSLTGLARIAQAEIPFVRFSGPYSASDWRLYRENKEEYFRRFDLVVRTAEQHNIGLIPSLFWTLSLCELVGEPRDQWGNPQSKTIALMRQYTGEVMNRYKASPAIWGWEFGNEHNLLVDLPNAAQFRPKSGTGTERDDVTAEIMTVMLSEFAKTVRMYDKTRPIFSGHSHPRPYAWHNSNRRSWTFDSPAQAREIILRDNPAPLDTITIHFYGIKNVDTELGKWVLNRQHYLMWLREIADQYKRPIFVGEFGLADKSDGPPSRPVFEAQLAELEKAEIDLAAFWVYDRVGGGGGWSATFENERAYMITLTALANRRLQTRRDGQTINGLTLEQE